MPKRSIFHGGGQASSNWRYFTEADRTGPRGPEMIMSTTLAKERFLLATSDLETIQGYRQSGARSTLTMYYVNDLKAKAIAKFGQHKFDNEVPQGRELSGVAAKERAEKEERERAAAQVSADQGKYAVVPPERLGNKKIYQLQEVLKRCGDFRATPPSKAECVERILAAGYDMDKERVFMEEQKQADDARAAQLAIQRAEHAAHMEKQKEEAAAKAKAKEAEKVARLARFAAGSLPISDLKYDEIQTALVQYGVRGKEIVGKKEELRAKLQVAYDAASATKRKVDETAGAGSSKDAAEPPEKRAKPATEGATPAIDEKTRAVLTPLTC